MLSQRCKDSLMVPVLWNLTPLLFFSFLLYGVKHFFISQKFAYYLPVAPRMLSWHLLSETYFNFPFFIWCLVGEISRCCVVIIQSPCYQAGVLSTRVLWLAKLWTCQRRPLSFVGKQQSLSLQGQCISDRRCCPGTSSLDLREFKN